MISNQYFQLTYQEIKNSLVVSKYVFYGFNDDILSEGQRINEWPSKMEVHVNGQYPTDNVFCPLKPWLLISKKVRTMLEESDIQGIQFLPINVVHQSGFIIPGYSIINIVCIVKGLNYENSTWLTLDKWNVKYPQLDIVDIVINNKAVVGLDIFRIEEIKTQIFISKRLIHLFKQRNDIVGFKFLPVKSI